MFDLPEKPPDAKSRRVWRKLAPHDDIIRLLVMKDGSVQVDSAGRCFTFTALGGPEHYVTEDMLRLVMRYLSDREEPDYSGSLYDAWRAARAG